MADVNVAISTSPINVTATTAGVQGPVGYINTGDYALVFYFASNLTYAGKNSVNNPDKSKSYTASGQYMLFKREDYEAFGGHESLKGSIVEDLALARTVKTKLRRLFFIDGTKLVFTRMYPESLKQRWNGWKTCLFPGTKLTPPRQITGALLWFLWGLFAPVVLALTIRQYLLMPNFHWAFILISSILYITCGLSVFIYWNRKGAHQWVTYTFYPIVFFMFCFLLGYSALELLITKKTTWRGREYSQFWLTDNGVLIALAEGAVSDRLLELTRQIYPENQTLACYLEVLSKMSLHIIKIAYSALEAKGKLEPTDVLNILLTETAKISDQLQKEIINTLKEYPKEYDAFKKRMDLILDSLDKLKEMI